MRENTDGTDTAALVHFTNYDKDGQCDNSNSRGSYNYDTAETYLPTSTTWTNSALITFDDKVSRFINNDDLIASCGTISYSDTNYFKTCQFFFENSRFQSANLGRAGIWGEKNNENYPRIHTQSIYVVNNAGSDSKNSARPVIEIPYNSIEGYKERTAYNVTFNSQGGSSVDSIIRYENQVVGSLPTSTKKGFKFLGWFDENDNEITSDTIITGNITFYAHCEEIIDNLDYVFRIPGTCTFGGSSANITSSSNDCISTVNPTGESIDYTATANKYIDTLVSLYSEENYEKDYEIGFTINAYNGSSNPTQASLVNTKLENSTLKYPGLVFRKSDTAKFEITQTIGGTKATNSSLTYTNPIESTSPIAVVIERRDGVISFSFAGNDMTVLQDISGTSDYFNFHTWFGAAGSTADATATTASAQRYIIGTLSNLICI